VDRSTTHGTPTHAHSPEHLAHGLSVDGVAITDGHEKPPPPPMPELRRTWNKHEERDWTIRIAEPISWINPNKALTGARGGDSVRAHIDEAIQPLSRPNPGINDYYPVLLVIWVNGRSVTYTRRVGDPGHDKPRPDGELPRADADLHTKAPRICAGSVGVTPGFGR
jgi:hypothetical protein